MGVIETLRSLLRGRAGRGTMPPEEPGARRSVDTALVIEAARLVVTTRAASRALLERQLYVAPEVADQLLGRLEHCEVIAPEQPGRSRRVITTSAQLPGVIEEFTRRDAS